MAKRFYGSIAVENQSQLQLKDSDSSNQVNLQSPATLAADYTLTLPVDDGLAGQGLSTDGSGALSWVDFLLETLAENSVFVGNASNEAVAVDTAAQGDISADATGLNIKAGVIVNADVNATAAIELTKLAALTANTALETDASGFIISSAITSTELNFLDGVTSNIQTQLDGKASTALDNLTVAGLANESLLVGVNANSVESLPVGADNQVLTVVAGEVAWADATSGQATAENWVTGDGTTKVITHNFGTLDIDVTIFDLADNADIEVDSVVRTDINTLTLTSSAAPNASGWRVLIKEVG